MRNPQENCDLDSRSKTWHGEPMFAIRRAIALLGTAQVSLLPLDVQSQLRTLHTLYFIDDPQGYPDEYLSAVNKQTDKLLGPTKDIQFVPANDRVLGPDSTTEDAVRKLSNTFSKV
ncbi:uncharacterized protein N7496_007834 [Penicillium cataractarum]|uniref:Uncharacterized protein n=1 Tax=Penicillium cataractarum TaxID=2100454 RepID=A0A9W9RZU0_9EURO|nr:uncharacterized protein N7496_007834 [Penicillium cataractarum]KAJ5368074.1 hypothetical protein N7496_007834 [Penicillium cataractarum]